MKVAFFSAQPYDQRFFEQCLQRDFPDAGFHLTYLTPALDADTVALGLLVARVPGYSPQAVAEHTLALVMTLNRHTHRAYNRVREGNLMLDGRRQS